MKKVVKIIGIVLGIIIILGIIFFAIDDNRVKKQETPIFCVNVGTLNDGGTKEYLGLGYKVIDFHTLAGYDDIKIGNWFIDYNDFDDEMRIYDKKFEESQEDDAMDLNKSVNFTKTYNVITDLKRTDQTGEYNYYVIEQYQLGEPTVVKVSTMYNLQENVNYEFSFEGIKTKNKEYSIQEIFNTFTIVNIEKTNKVGMEQRIDSIAENFEILFYDKHPMESYKIYTILDKSETNKYDYTIYGYDGNRDVYIGTKDLKLTDVI